MFRKCVPDKAQRVSEKYYLRLSELTANRTGAKSSGIFSAKCKQEAIQLINLNQKIMTTLVSKKVSAKGKSSKQVTTVKNAPRTNVKQKKAAGESLIKPPLLMKSTTGQKIDVIDVALIVCNPYNPRKYHSDEELLELAASIKNHGIIQPITVRAKDDMFEIVCGERRYGASLIAGLKTIPVIITQLSDDEAIEVTIIENLHRKDISPIEEAHSFKMLLEKRKFAIEELSELFGKSDKYVRGRLQLCNLIEEIAILLSENELTIGNALELSKLCVEAQQEVYEVHLKEDDGYQCWRKLSISDLCDRLERQYCRDLTKYSFDKTECEKCPFNSANNDLFATEICGSCQNEHCLVEKQRQFMIATATQMVDNGTNLAVCVRPYHNGDPEVITGLKEQGIEIHEMHPKQFPEMPEAPLAEAYETTEDYQEAIIEYEADVVDYETSVKKLEAMEAEGKIQRMIDVSDSVPNMCYRIVSEDEEPMEDPVKKLKDKDKHNSEICKEKTIVDVKEYVKDKSFPDTDFTVREEELLYYVMILFLRRDQYKRFGIKDTFLVTDEQKQKIVKKLTEQQKTILKRDFIAKNLADTCRTGKQAELFVEFAKHHFSDAIAQIERQHTDIFNKRHKSLMERIRAAKKAKKEEEKKTLQQIQEEISENLLTVVESTENAGINSEANNFISQETESQEQISLPETVTADETAEQTVLETV